MLIITNDSLDKCDNYTHKMKMLYSGYSREAYSSKKERLEAQNIPFY